MVVIQLVELQINTSLSLSQQFGMKINIKKTKAMCVSKKPNSPKINIAIDGQRILNKCHHSLITEDGRCEKEINRRIMIARTTFTNMRTLLSCRGINLKTRLRAIKCYIWPTLFYGEETWTITKSLLSKLDAFEMWVYRRVLKMSWTEKKYQRGSIEKDGDRQYLGHLIRHNSSQLQLIEGNIEGEDPVADQEIPGQLTSQLPKE